VTKTRLPAMSCSQHEALAHNQNPSHQKPMVSATAILKQLKAQASPANLDGMARFGMAIDKRLGISVPVMRQIARQAGKNHQLALKLWQTGYAEARIVASMVAVPEQLTDEQIESWVKGINSWDVCDQFCMNLLWRVSFARQKIAQWARREEEFVKRAAYALIACLAWHDKTAADREFLQLLTIIKQGATDERNFVRKAVNWALRGIGKRSVRLNKAAIKTAKEIQRIDSKAARWIAADALRELERAAVQRRLAARL
jgi:3-methyladenine DNA glycosylase AlkD